MDASPKRLVEVRLLVVVTVDVAHDELADIVLREQPASIGEVVVSEIVSNLESVGYIEVAIATTL